MLGLLDLEAMKLYTRTGDADRPALRRETACRKTHPRVEAMGPWTSLNSVPGPARARQRPVHRRRRPTRVPIWKILQNALFDLGADLASCQDSPYAWNIARIDEQDVGVLGNGDRSRRGRRWLR